MGQAIGDILPMAVGVALSPVPIIAIVLMLGTPRARSNGPAVALGWLAGLTIAGGVMLAIASGRSQADDGTPETWVSVLKLVIGIVFLLLAVRTWRGRPRAGGGDAQVDAGNLDGDAQRRDHDHLAARPRGQAIGRWDRRRELVNILLK
jgi:threonine/homoserine/homoserine lactone efflux protein